MDRKTAEVAKKFAGRLRAKFDVQKIILFGSRARGDNFKNSDYDFVIVSKSFADMKFPERMGKVYQYWAEGHYLEPLCYTPEEFERKKRQLGIVRKAAKEGSVV